MVFPWKLDVFTLPFGPLRVQELLRNATVRDHILSKRSSDGSECHTLGCYCPGRGGGCVVCLPTQLPEWILECFVYINRRGRPWLADGREFWDSGYGQRPDIGHVNICFAPKDLEVFGMWFALKPDLIRCNLVGSRTWYHVDQIRDVACAFRLQALRKIAIEQKSAHLFHDGPQAAFGDSVLFGVVRS